MSLDKTVRRVMAVDESCGVPTAIYLDNEDLVQWIEDIGYPQYKECFEKNFITGRHLIGLDASKLPSMGITDFEHIKDITAEIRLLLHMEKPIKNMNISMGDPMIAYLQQKRRTGHRTKHMTFQSFMLANKRWFPRKY